MQRPTGLIEGSGREGDRKALDHMVSVRFDVPTLRALRLFTEETGRSFSEVIRTAVLDYIDEHSDVPHQGTPLTTATIPKRKD
jgi:Ribbon-helix-helix protein, copG family